MPVDKLFKNYKGTEANTSAYFQYLWQVWRGLGISIDIDERYRLLFTLYSVFINSVVTIFYPIHLSLMLFQSDNMSDNIKNMAVTVTVVACGIKFRINTLQLKSIQYFGNLLDQLDSRISAGPELDYFRQLKRLLRNISILFLSLYVIIGIVGVLAFIFSEERRLLYTAWFPFNWQDNTLYFCLANAYQIVGIFIFILQNYVNDSFPSMALCVLSGHIEILSIRVANIGYDKKTKQENEEEMIKCVKDQKLLYELFSTTESIISVSMFIQFTVTGINMCVSMAALLFYATAPLDMIYYFTFFLAMPLEIFPACYYGSEFQYRFSQLHRSVFCCNWVEQSPKFKKNMIIFTERSLKEDFAIAGGMVPIHLETFFSTCKGAYSLFAVIMNMK